MNYLRNITLCALLASSLSFFQVQAYASTEGSSCDTQAISPLTLKFPSSTYNSFMKRKKESLAIVSPDAHTHPPEAPAKRKTINKKNTQIDAFTQNDTTCENTVKNSLTHAPKSKKAKVALEAPSSFGSSSSSADQYSLSADPYSSSVGSSSSSLTLFPQIPAVSVLPPVLTMPQDATPQESLLETIHAHAFELDIAEMFFLLKDHPALEEDIHWDTYNNLKNDTDSPSDESFEDLSW